MKFISSSIFALIGLATGASATGFVSLFNDGAAGVAGLTTSSDGTSSVASFNLGPAGINVPTSKDILVGLSAEVNLLTGTTAKGNNKQGSDESMAEATLTGTVKFIKESAWDLLENPAEDVCNPPDDLSDSLKDEIMTAIPGPVTFKARKQTLSVDVALDIESESDLCTDCEITGYVEVGLTLETTAASHFNFIAQIPETASNSDPYKFYACWETTAETEAENGSAESYVAIQKQVMVLQTVEGFVKGDYWSP